MKIIFKPIIFKGAAVILMLLPLVAANATNPAGDYFGQALPGDEPEILAPGFVSVQGRYEYGCSFAPDGKTFLFSAEFPGKPSAIMITELKNGTWSKPVKADFTKGKNPAEMEAFFAPDNKTVYFTGFEKKGCSIFKVTKTGSIWGQAEKLPAVINTGAVFYPVPATDGSLYISDVKLRKIMVAAPGPKNSWRVKESGIPFGLHGFISPDNQILVFDAKKDLYVCFWQRNSQWSAPVKVDYVSTDNYSETCPSITPDGKYLLFSRYNEPNEIANIFWVSTGPLKKLRNKTKNY